MNILIIKKIKTDIHGTATMAERLFSFFNNNGYNCYLTKYTESKVVDSFSFQHKILKVNEYNIVKHKNEYKNLSFDVLLCLTTDDAITGFRLQQKFFKNAKVIIGVYHPFQFMCPTNFITNFKEYFNRKLINKIGYKNIYFMDEPCKKSHEDYYEKHFDLSPIVPLPLNIVGVDICKNEYKKNKVISAGRLNYFKKYPFEVLESMYKLKNNGNLNFQFYIIGDGAEFNNLQKRINELVLSEDVFLLGQVPYNELIDKIKDAYLFIGMGTAVGEAAGLGVPCLVSIAYEEKLSYGLLGRLPNNILGDFGEPLPTFSYGELLSKVYSLSDDEYKKERELSLKQAAYYKIDSVASTFLDVFDNAEVNFFKVNFIQNLFYILAKIQIRFFSKKGFFYK